MRSKKRIGLTLAAASVTALAAAPGAQAVPFDTAHDSPCEAPAAVLSGAGSSFQKTAQIGWGAEILPVGGTGAAPATAQGFGYDTGCHTFKLAADGGTKKIQYAPTGSGAGKVAMGATATPGAARDLTVQFGGTEEAPSTTELANANNGPDVASTSDDGVLNTIPVAQGTAAVVLRIPDNCEIPSASARQLSRVKLENAFAASGTKFDQWVELFGSNIKAIPGNAGGLTDAQCQAKKFKRVVRPDSSGTTFQFKKYLAQASAKTGGSGTSWSEPGLANTAWPNDSGATATVRGAANGGGALVTALTAQGTNGGIGYVDLGTARAGNYGWNYLNPTTSSQGTVDPQDEQIWVRVQSISSDTYVDPAKTDNQHAGCGSAANPCPGGTTSTVMGKRGVRCGAVTYNHVPATTQDSWFDVDAVETAADYPICTLTYALTFKSLASIGMSSPQSKARARKDYLGYMLDAPGLGSSGKGQGKLPVNDYGTLPASIRTIALAGVASLEA